MRRGPLRCLLHCLLPWAIAAAVGCAAVTESNPPGPPPQWTRPYAGRIVLSSSTLHGAVEDFDKVWSQRLSILGLQSRIVYDDARAVFDVYGAPPSALPGVAGVLADAGGWRLGDPLDSGFVTDWLPPTAGCECGGQMRIRIDPSIGCHLRTSGGPIELSRPGVASRFVAGLHVRWHYRVKLGANLEGYAEGETENPDGSLKCPDEVWPKITVLLLPGTSPEQATGIALALGGGKLPEIPRVDSVTLAGDTRQP